MAVRFALMRPAAIGRRVLLRIARRDRLELTLLVGALVVLVLALAFMALAGEVLEGDTQAFDNRMLAALRRPDDPSMPIGPSWLQDAALDVTALGGPTVLGLTVIAIVGFLLLQGLVRTAAFVFVASTGGWLLQEILKQLFGRVRPQVVPHLREVMSPSFPSGHALTSAAVYLTLGALLMRIARRPVTKFYCMAIAMVATFLVGASRVYLGVHYPTDVLGGWLIGLLWAVLCWIAEWMLERRAGLKHEQREREAAS